MAVECNPYSGNQSPGAVTKEFRNHARALLLSLGKDPNPSNVSKLVQVESAQNKVRISAEALDYWVYDETSFVEIQQEFLLSKPWALPSKFLALFILDSFTAEVDFASVIQVAENFRQNLTPDSKFHLFEMIQRAKNLDSRIDEIVMQEFGSNENMLKALHKLFGYENFSMQVYNNQTYYIFGFKPKFKLHQDIEECA